MSEHELRDVEQAQKDLILPIYDFGGADNVRYMAALQVLSRIPEEDYNKLKSEDFQWFIPDYETRGLTMPFFPDICPDEKSPYARVVFLSPLLERAALSINIAIVAHELAHIVLNHDIMGLSPSSYEEQEEEAWSKIQKWGFEKEYKKYKAIRKQQETIERKHLEELKSKLKIGRGRDKKMG